MTFRRLWLWVPPIVYMIAIFHVSSQSEPLPAVTAVVWDKLLHLVEYGVLAVLLARGFSGEGAGQLASVGLALLVASAYGASDESHQAFVPLRQSDVRDWIADTIGAAAGAALYAIGMHAARTASRSER